MLTGWPLFTAKKVKVLTNGCDIFVDAADYIFMTYVKLHIQIIYTHGSESRVVYDSGEDREEKKKTLLPSLGRRGSRRREPLSVWIRVCWAVRLITWFYWFFWQLLFCVLAERTLCPNETMCGLLFLSFYNVVAYIIKALTVT